MVSACIASDAARQRRMDRCSHNPLHIKVDEAVHGGCSYRCEHIFLGDGLSSDAALLRGRVKSELEKDNGIGILYWNLFTHHVHHPVLHPRSHSTSKILS